MENIQIAEGYFEQIRPQLEKLYPKDRTNFLEIKKLMHSMQ